MRFPFIIVILYMFISIGLAYSADPSLIIYLPMDDGKGNEVKDASLNGRNGKIVGGAKWVDGKFGRGVELVATGDEIQVVDDGKLDGMKALTIEIWVKQDNHQATGIIQKGTNWPGISYLLQPWSDQQIYFGVNDTSSRAITKPGDYPLGKWYHLAGTYDGKTLKIFIDGKEKASAAAPVDKVPDTENPLQIGNRLIGVIDEFAMYSRVLTEDEIKRDMNGIVMSVEKRGKIETTWALIKRSIQD